MTAAGGTPATLRALDAAVPTIYVVEETVPAVSLAGRLLAAGIGSACLAVLILAATLEPSPSGVGTHRTSLGLPPCNFLITSGLPCPSCGMTTSFAWLARGNLVASFYVQPMGAILGLLAAVCVWAGLYIALTGQPAHRLLHLLPPRYTIFPLLLAGVLAWAWKIVIHLNGIDGWKAQ